MGASERSRLDSPYEPQVVRAAVRFSTGEELAVRLLALHVLARVASDPAEKVTREFEASARRAFVAEHRDNLFFRMFAIPSDLSGASASEAEVADLEEALGLPRKPPNQELFAAFKKALGQDAKAERQAFILTVTVSTGLFDLHEFAGWLERGEHPVARRAAVLSKLGEAVSRGTWLVDNYIGLGLLRSSLRLQQDEAVARKAATIQARLESLRTGPGGVQSVGHWPWPVGSVSIERLVEDEMGELTRLQGLKP